MLCLQCQALPATAPITLISPHGMSPLRRAASLFLGDLWEFFYWLQRDLMQLKWCLRNPDLQTPVWKQKEHQSKLLIINCWWSSKMFYVQYSFPVCFHFKFFSDLTSLLHSKTFFFKKSALIQHLSLGRECWWFNKNSIIQRFFLELNNKMTMSVLWHF